MEYCSGRGREDAAIEFRYCPVFPRGELKNATAIGGRVVQPLAQANDVLFIPAPPIVSRGIDPAGYVTRHRMSRPVKWSRLGRGRRALTASEQIKNTLASV